MIKKWSAATLVISGLVLFLVSCGRPDLLALVTRVMQPTSMILHRVYLPSIVRPLLVKGAVWSFNKATLTHDAELLGVKWYPIYSWACPSDSSIECVPMLTWTADGQPKMPSCAPIALIENEPDLTHVLTIQQAATWMLALEKQCPHTKYIAWNVGNTFDPVLHIYVGEQWIRDFKQTYRNLSGHEYAGGIGVHCYAWLTADYCLERLAILRSLHSSTMWVTEFSIFSTSANAASPSELVRLANFIQQNFQRYAYWEVRYNGQSYEFPESYRVELIDASNNLTVMGQTYAAFGRTP